jgi:hypothetical protein
MDYRIQEIRFGYDPTTYFKPLKSGKYGLYEEYSELRGGVCKTYEDALNIINKNHMIVVKTHQINLQ